MATETSTAIYAWALKNNHAHVLLGSGPAGLAKFMRRFLTGYAVTYNLRHHRHGQLFQNRYKSIVCDGDRYFTELVRYIHLNPLRVKLVADLAELERYPHCGHGVVLGTIRNEWQDRDSVLAQFGEREGEAKSAYRRFVAEGVQLGRRPELVGGGLVRSQGGWSEVKTLRRRGRQEMADERILGSGDFVARVIREAEARAQRLYAGGERGRRVERLIAEACKKSKVSLTELRSGSRRGAIPALRADLSRRLVENYGITVTRRQPGGRFRLTPLYDVMSVQPAFDAGQLRKNQMKFAMAVGDKRSQPDGESMKGRCTGETGDHQKIRFAETNGVGLSCASVRRPIALATSV